MMRAMSWARVKTVVRGQETIHLDAEAVDLVVGAAHGPSNARCGHAVFHLIEVAEQGCRTIGIHRATLAIVVERTIALFTGGLHLQHTLGGLRAETVNGSIEPRGVHHLDGLQLAIVGVGVLHDIVEGRAHQLAFVGVKRKR